MNIVLGVGGGIAAYKAAELARRLADHGQSIQVVMTAAAREFIQPLTFAALTNRKVITGLFDPDQGLDGDGSRSSSVEHIQVAQDNQLLLIAPATADLLAKLAGGHADDFLTTLYLAFTGDVVIAPAMNTNMWLHAATQANVEILRARGNRILTPPEGMLACGTSGPGRLAEVDEIVSAVLDGRRTVLTAPLRRDLEGERIVITAGPTREPLDPVRFISNRSSGKMGYALADAAAVRGASVLLISGPVTIPAPDEVDLLLVETAAEMRRAVMEQLDAATIIVKSAAVADYYLSQIPKQKVKKTAMRMSLELDPTPDILAEVGQRKGDRLLIGFAAETENLIDEARRKMASKNCDMIVANLVTRDNIVFESDDNEVVLVMKTGEIVPIARAAKRTVADAIFDHALRLRLALHAAAS